MAQRYEFAYATTHWISPSYLLAPGRTVASDQLRYGGVTSTRAVEPFAGWMRGYQRFAYVPGALLGVLLLVGLGGIVRSWRGGGFRRLDGWGGPGLFPWVASVTLLVVPVMTADFSERYALIAMPVICLAAALAFAPRDPGAPPRQAAAPAPEEVPAAGPAAPARSAATPASPPADGAGGPAASPARSAATPAGSAAADSAADGPAAPAGPATPAASPATPPGG